MLHIPPQKSSGNIIGLIFSLIWSSETYVKRRLLGHTGSVPCITTAIVKNEKRDPDLIILKNGDVTPGNLQMEQVLDTT